ncbi:MAG: cytochrome c oxidase subunit II [Acidobacteria bacterium]|nr:cytochrome c oxidase subunit II [Acidobacteriota bacterium]
MQSGISFLPEQASTLAPRVDNLYFFIVAVTAFFALLVTVLVVYFAFKYHTDDPYAVGAPIHGSIPLELFWTAVPFVIAIFIFAWSTNVYFDIVRPPDQAMQVYSVGKRWMWKFQHPSGQREINELHVPVGRPVKVTFTSEDVLHDLFIPAFRVKADAIPGRYSTIWFTATQTGEYHLFCAEYCGTKHAGMIGRVIVMEETAYQAWLDTSQESSLAAQGQALYESLSCQSCHLNDGNGRGPALHGLFGSEVQLANGTTATVDEGYLRESILNSQMRVVAGYNPIMPTFQGLVDEDGMVGLIEYIKSLRTGPSSEGASASLPAEAGEPE